MPSQQRAPFPPSASTARHAVPAGLKRALPLTVQGIGRHDMPRNRRSVSENPDGDDFSCRRCATGGTLPPALRIWFLILISHILPYSLCNMRKFWLNCGAQERNSYAVVRVVAFGLRLNSAPNSFGTAWWMRISPFPPQRISSPVLRASRKGWFFPPLDFFCIFGDRPSDGGFVSGALLSGTSTPNHPGGPTYHGASLTVFAGGQAFGTPLSGECTHFAVAGGFASGAVLGSGWHDRIQQRQGIQHDFEVSLAGHLGPRRRF